MKKYAIIVAGGSGSRMGTQIPKQFIVLAGKPVLMHTIQVFYNFDPMSEIILVIPENQHTYWHQLCAEYLFELPHQVVTGGETRFHSVKNGLSRVDSEGIVFIHDGVRPLVSQSTLERCFEKAILSGNAIPVLPVTESLRKINGALSVAVDRSDYLSVQTPQTFKSEVILKSFQQPYEQSFTDDASVAEKAGFDIHLVEGNPENIKITTPTDLIFVQELMKATKI